MTPQPQDEPVVGQQPLTNLDAARHVVHLTGMTPEAATAFVSFHSGLRSAAWHETA